MKRLLASVLALAMVLGVCLMAGCGNDDTPATTTTKKDTPVATTTGNNDNQTTEPNGNNDNPAATTTAGGEDVVTTTEAPVETEWEGYTKVPGMENITFRGKKFVIAGYQDCADGFNSIREVYSEDTDAIAVAARERNAMVEALYDCTIEFNGSDAPGTLVNNEVTSGKKTIDIYTSKYAVGYYKNTYNLYTLGMDLTAEWWDQNYVAANTMKNNSGADTLFGIVGDFALSAASLTHAIMFNKNVYETSVVQKTGYDIYQLVRDGEWTMDIFIEMIKAGANDVSGNQTIDYSEGDIVGWATTTHATHGLHIASGLSIISTENGVMKFNVQNDVAQWDTVIDKAIEVWALPEHDNTGYSDGQTAIVSGKALFYSDIIQKLEESTLKDSDTAVGLVPYPKYSSTQENYSHYVDNHLMTYHVPTSVSEIEEVGDFFEVYAAHSTAIVRPAWIDAYAYEYCGDADSGEMLDIILDTRSYDPGYLVFSTIEGEISNMISSGKNNVTKWVDKRAASIAGAGGLIEERVKAISEVDA